MSRGRILPGVTAQAPPRGAGIPVKISSSAAVAAASEIGKRPGISGKNIVVIRASSAERYQPTPLFDELQAPQILPEPCASSPEALPPRGQRLGRVGPICQASDRQPPLKRHHALMGVNGIEDPVIIEVGLLRLSPSAKLGDGQKTDLRKSSLILTGDFRIARAIEILSADFLTLAGIDESEERFGGLSGPVPIDVLVNHRYGWLGEDRYARDDDLKFVLP